jgi:small GTP-binding protein
MSTETTSYLHNEDMISYRFIGKVIIIGDSGTGKSSLFNKMIGRGYCGNIPPTIGVDFHSVGIPIEADKLPSHIPDISSIVHESSQGQTVNGKESRDLACGSASKKKKAESYGVGDKTRNHIVNVLKNRLKKTPGTASIGVKLQVWDAAGQEKFRRIVQGFYKNVAVVILVFDIFNKKSFEHLACWIEDIENANNFKHGLPLYFLVGNKKDLIAQNQVRQVKPEEIYDFCHKYGILCYDELSAKLDEETINDFVSKVAHEFYYHIEFVQELTNTQFNRYVYENNDHVNGLIDLKEDNKIKTKGCCNLL